MLPSGFVDNRTKTVEKSIFFFFEYPKRLLLGLFNDGKPHTDKKKLKPV